MIKCGPFYIDLNSGARTQNGIYIVLFARTVPGGVGVVVVTADAVSIGRPDQTEFSALAIAPLSVGVALERAASS